LTATVHHGLANSQYCLDSTQAVYIVNSHHLTSQGHPARIPLPLYYLVNHAPARTDPFLRFYMFRPSKHRWGTKASSSAVHLVAGCTTSPVLARIARSELARPLVNASVERFSRANHVFTCILLQSSILHRLFGCIRSVSGSASYGVQGHSGNARMQTHADAQQARASSPVLSTRCFCDLCTLH